jgi:hypothetical protein
VKVDSQAAAEGCMCFFASHYTARIFEAPDIVRVFVFGEQSTPVILQDLNDKFTFPSGRYIVVHGRALNS